MAATRTNLITLSMAGTSGLFHHATEATLAEVLAPGYFELTATMLRVNDVILVCGTHLPAVPLRVALVEANTKRVTVETSWTPPAAAPLARAA
jgi:hypothetical protein